MTFWNGVWFAIGFFAMACTATGYICLYVGGQSEQDLRGWEETQWLEERRRMRKAKDAG